MYTTVKAVLVCLCGCLCLVSMTPACAPKFAQEPVTEIDSDASPGATDTIDAGPKEQRKEAVLLPDVSLFESGVEKGTVRDKEVDSKCLCGPDEVCLRIFGGVCRQPPKGEDCRENETSISDGPMGGCCLFDERKCWKVPAPCTAKRTCKCFETHAKDERFQSCGNVCSKESENLYSCALP